MSLPYIPQESEKFEIQTFKKPSNLKNFRKTHVPFSGSPRKHPYDQDKVLLHTDPYSSFTTYYEFNTKDILYVQELPSIVNMDEETVTMVRVWVKKKSVGLRFTPFVVDDVVY